MEQHVKVLAAFHIVFGALGLIAALGILIVFGGAAGAAGYAAANEPDAWIAVPILSIVGSILMLIALTLSVPGIVAGWGLLQYKPWARLLMIVLSAPASDQRSIRDAPRDLRVLGAPDKGNGSAIRRAGPRSRRNRRF